jgi:hypothetical protein
MSQSSEGIDNTQASCLVTRAQTRGACAPVTLPAAPESLVTLATTLTPGPPVGEGRLEGLHSHLLHKHSCHVPAPPLPR